MKRSKEGEDEFTPPRKVEKVVNGDNSSFVIVPVFPAEILEILFTHLSYTDLFHCQLVCRQWNEIISRNGFLDWRKMYYRTKMKEDYEELTRLILENGLSFASSTFVQTLTKLATQLLSSKFNRECTTKAMGILRTNSLYSIIEKSTPLQSLLSAYQDKSSQLIATITCLTVLSKDVFEIKLVFNCLMSCFGIAKATEVFYFFATVFFYLWRKDVIPQRLHYQTLYILKNFEKSEALSDTITLTQEQMKIVQHAISVGDIIKIIAFAGTGKTTSLIHLAQINSDHKFLYLCFNKSVSTHAGSVFGNNVKTMTFHALAYGSVGKGYDRDRKVLFGSLSYDDISNVVKGSTRFRKDILTTLENFMASADFNITTNHLPDEVEAEDDDVFEYLDKVLAQAKLIWQTMIDHNDFSVKITHDGYLKLYQLKQCKIMSYDCIMVDEAQDITPAIISILQAQDCPQIIVGDPHQQIYGFRGATNGLDYIQPTHTYYLTESFRFGPNIAFISSCLLECLKDVYLQTLTGGYQEGGYTGVTDGQVAVIARTNISLFKEMFSLIESKPDCKIAVAGNESSYGFDELLDIYRFLTKTDLHKIRSGSVRKFLRTKSSFYQFKKHAEDLEDISTINKIKICEQYCHRLPYLINTIKEKIKSNSQNLETADIVFSTAHKSKGLEFDTVIMTDDYLDSLESMQKNLNITADDFINRREFGKRFLNDIPVDERNLMYVAVTRARKQVFLSRNVIKVLSIIGEHFVHPSLLSEGTSSMACSNCSYQSVNECCFVKERIVLGSRRSLSRTGPICNVCTNKYVPHLVSIL